MPDLDVVFYVAFPLMIPAAYMVVKGEIGFVDIFGHYGSREYQNYCKPTNWLRAAGVLYLLTVLVYLTKRLDFKMTIALLIVSVVLFVIGLVKSFTAKVF